MISSATGCLVAVAVCRRLKRGEGLAIGSGGNGVTRFMATRGVASARAVFLVALMVSVLVPCWADAQRPDALPYAVTPGRTAGSEAAGASTPPTAAV